MNINELINERAGLVVESRKLLDAASARKRELTSDEDQKWTEMNNRIDEIGRIIERENRQAQIEKTLENQRDLNRETIFSTAPAREKNPEVHNELLARYLTGAMDLREACNTLGTQIDTKGGFTLPTTVTRDIIRLVYNTDPLRSIADVRSSDSLTSIPVQTGGITGAWIGENGTYPQVSPNLGRETLTAHKLGFIVPVSEELLADSASDIVGFVVDAAGQAFSDTANPAYYTGVGTDRPFGFYNVTRVGGASGVLVQEHTTAVSGTATLTADDLIDTQHRLIASERPFATWVMHDSTQRHIRKLKSNDNQYIWQPGLTQAQPNMLLGSPVAVSDHNPQMAVSQRSIAYGNFRKAVRIHDRLAWQVMYLNELLAGNGQKGWRFTARTDSRVVNGQALVFLRHGNAS